ncbi:WYL domain-containing protein [Actinomadura miaoliensis]|uniref:WYL domain-containing protein n=1 Tax=Actinomadura miaoliensis TaxID=430685 RepID=UPI003CD06A5C
MYSLAPTYEVVATLRLPAGQVERRLGAAAGDIEPIDDRSCRLRGPADTLEWTASRLLMLGCEFEVHEPPELVAYLRALGARATRAAQAPGGARTGRQGGDR